VTAEQEKKLKQLIALLACALRRRDRR